MTAKREELLYLMLWGLDKLMRPTFRNLNDSFESWCYRNGLLAQIHRLEAQKFVERRTGKLGEIVCRLTDTGRIKALGGRDPVAHWAWEWDGLWRTVMFDIPEQDRYARKRLRELLRKCGLGCLQGSVWVSPRPLEEVLHGMAKKNDKVKSLLTLESRPCSGESDTAIVAGAWDFDEINRRYEDCSDVLDRMPAGGGKSVADAARWQRWAIEERETWTRAIRLDPFLPNALLPKGYLGKDIFNRRMEGMRRAHVLVRSTTLA